MALGIRRRSKILGVGGPVERVSPARRHRSAVGQAKELFPRFLAHHVEMSVLDEWYKGEHEMPKLPATASAEHKELLADSPTPWGSLVVGTVSQALYVEGHRQPRTVDQSPLWEKAWQPNGLDAKQIPLHRGALSLGQAWNRVLPGVSPLTRESQPSIKGFSAIDALGFYRDEGNDEYPETLIHATTQLNARGEEEWFIHLWDDNADTMLRANFDSSEMAYIEERAHDVGVTPWIRYANMIDLRGETTGEIAPLLPLIKRIDQDTYDRLVVQRFGAWRVRTIAGMDKPTTDAERRAASLALRVEDLLVSSDPATKFDTLEPTSLDGYIKARDADIRDLAAVSQTPPHHLLGQMANLSAEALAAAEASLMRKVDERQHTFGEAHEQTLRLAAHVMGRPELAADYGTQVVWRDTESRSLNQVADALVKLATGLKIPVEMLWGKLPFWSDQDTLAAKEILRKQAASQELLDAILLGADAAKLREVNNTDVGTGGPQETAAAALPPAGG